jgi:hypothetical protein
VRPGSRAQRGQRGPLFAMPVSHCTQHPSIPDGPARRVLPMLSLLHVYEEKPTSPSQRPAHAKAEGSSASGRQVRPKDGVVEPNEDRSRC